MPFPREIAMKKRNCTCGNDRSLPAECQMCDKCIQLMDAMEAHFLNFGVDDNNDEDDCCPDPN